jgi:Flp pilus assembly protein TadG
MSKCLLQLTITGWLRSSHKQGADDALTGAPIAHRKRPSPLVSERGSNLIEMSFVMIIILALVGGVVDFGGAFEQYIVITNAAREGARRYAILPCKADNRTGLTEAVEDTVLIEVAGAIADAVISEPGGGNVTLTSGNVIMTPDPRSGCPAAGSPVVVAVEIDYDSMFGGFAGTGALRLRAEASMVYQGTD